MGALSTLYLTGGYGWTPSWTRADPPRAWGSLAFTDEHRLWQQVLWVPSDARTGATAMARARLEQRVRPGQGRAEVRLRAMWRGQVPFDRARRFSLIVWDEVFLGSSETGWGQPRGVDQIRTFAGLGWQAVPTWLRLEVGYTNVWLVRRAPIP